MQVLSILVPKENSFFFKFEAPSKEHVKRTAHDVFDTLATHASLVRDVTDTEHKMAALMNVFGQLSNKNV